MKNKIKLFIFNLVLAFTLIAQVNVCFAQTAGLLLNARQQFFDKNGNPLSLGTVTTYVPGTSTLKTTWMDSGEVTPNTNPINLDASGYATIYGQGTYRQVVKDRNGNLVWDAVTVPGGSTGSATLIGDGQLVGTVKPWAGIAVPAQYMYAYGEAISRVSFPDLFLAITITENVTCNNSSATINGLTDTTQISIGSVVELNCVPAGTTVASKTASSVTLSNPSNVSQVSSATFFPFGDGDGSTTFNLPDLRGVALIGRPNMDGSLTGKGNITSTFYGSNPNGLGQIGGNQSATVASGNLPTTPINVASIAANVQGLGTQYQYCTTFGGGTCPAGNTNIVVVGSGTGASTGNPAAMIMPSPGSNVTFTNPGNITLNTSGSQSPISIIQPSIAFNYIIKVLPDINAATTNGVASIGGMTGVIICGSNLLCTSNTISVVSPSLSSIIVGTTLIGSGTSGDIEFNNGGTLGEKGVTGTGTVVLATSPSIASPTITGSFTATGLVTNADLANSSITIGSSSVSLGGTLTTITGNITLSGNITHSGQLIETGTSAPSSAAGNTVVMGTITAPTLSNNGQAFLYNTAVNGATVQGQGSTYDANLSDNAGSVAIGVLTGTTTVKFPGGITATGLTSGTCANSIVITSGNSFALGSCPGASASIQVGGTSVTSATNSNYLLGTGTVSAGTGTLANYQVGSGLAITSSTLSFASQAAFSANLNNTNQTGIPGSTPTLVAFNNVVYNIGSFFNTTTNRWTPPAGTVALTVQVFTQGVWPNSNPQSTYIYKNGSAISQTVCSAQTNQNVCGGAIEDRANGTDFYQVEVNQAVTSGSVTVNGGNIITYFMGHWVSP